MHHLLVLAYPPKTTTHQVHAVAATHAQLYMNRSLRIMHHTYTTLVVPPPTQSTHQLQAVAS